MRSQQQILHQNQPYKIGDDMWFLQNQAPAFATAYDTAYFPAFKETDANYKKG